MDRKDLDVTLYLVTDSSYHTEESLLRTVEEACKGGVTLVQGDLSYYYQGGDDPYQGFYVEGYL